MKCGNTNALRHDANAKPLPPLPSPSGPGARNRNDCQVFSSTLHCPWLLPTCALSSRPHCTVRDWYLLAHCLHVHTALSVTVIYLRTVFTSTLHCPWLLSTCALSLRPHCNVRDCYLLAHSLHVHTALSVTGIYLRTVFTSTLYCPWLLSTCALFLRQTYK